MDGFYRSDQLPPHHMEGQIPQQQQQQQQQRQQQPQPLQPQGQAPGQQQQPALSMGPPNGGSSLMGGGDSLDDILRDNHNDINRRRSMPQAYGTTLPQDPSAGTRRLSAVDMGDLMAFGNGDDGLDGYQFSQSMAVAGFPTIDTNMGMPDQMANFLGNDPSQYSALSPDMMGSMIPSTFANMSMGQMGNQMGGQMNDPMSNSMNNQMNGQMPSSMDSQMGNNSPALDMFSPSAVLNASFIPDQLPTMTNDFMDMSPVDTSMNATPTRMPSTMAERGDSMMDSQTAFNPATTAQKQAMPSMPMDSNLATISQNLPSLSRHASNSNSDVTPPQGTSQPPSTSTAITRPSTNSEAATPSEAPTPRDSSKEQTIYSKSGFDMLKALWLVATRKDPRIHLGAVDMSCAFVVCDVTMNDCPIIYVSDNFQNLTGYSRHEIVGQNCRFLQAPDGKVEAGSRREFVDDGAVYNLKKMIHEGREVQQSLINYRKGGKPFLNLLTMIPIPWDTEDIRYFIGFQIDLVECPDAIASNQGLGGVKVNYKHSDIGQYIWTPPNSSNWEPENGQTLGVDDVSTLLSSFSSLAPKAVPSDWHKQTWDKMLLENADDIVHVLSLKGLFLYLSPACKRVLEYDATDLVGNSLSTVCHPSDIVPVTRELKETTVGNTVNIVFRIRRKHSGYTWFESHGSLFVEQGKGRKCIILVGRKRPVFTLSRQILEDNGGIGDSELWTKLSTAGMFLYVSSNIRSLLDLQPENLVGTSIQDLMRKESRPEFGRTIEKARRGRTVSCKHEVQNRRGQVLQAQTFLYPGDASEGEKPSFLLAQTKLLKASSRSLAPANTSGSVKSAGPTPQVESAMTIAEQGTGQVSQPAGGALAPGSQDMALASEDNVFDELRTTKCSSWQFELRQMEKVNRILAEELGGLLSNKKKRKRRKGVGNVIRDCANCHTKNTPEWRRGPSGQRDLCNSCGLRWAKQTGRVSPRNSSRGATTVNGDSQSKKSASPKHHSNSPLHKDSSADTDGKLVDGEGFLSPAQLTKSEESSSATPSSSTPPGNKPSTTMPPPSQSSMTSGAQGPGMTSIQEERETSQP